MEGKIRITPEGEAPRLILKKVTALERTLSGTIRMTHSGGAVCRVSSRNVKESERLGLFVA